mgnify:CR=1 FL=1
MPKSSNVPKMPFTAEVSARLAKPKSCQALLYAPLDQPLTYRQTQRYAFEHIGDDAALTEFIRKVLVDDVCQDLHLGDTPAIEGAVFHLDYGMKPGALDLEKETILNYHREVADGRFEIQSLKIYKRLYIFGDPGETSPEPFIKDIVNPAIHTWSVTDVLSCA